jgi:hypothetical protein
MFRVHCKVLLTQRTLLQGGFGLGAGGAASASTGAAAGAERGEQLDRLR